MRVNLVDGAIFGIGISGIVLVVRWFFSDSYAFEQIAVIGIGAVALFAIQIALDRWRTQRTQSAETAESLPESELPPEQLAPLVTPPSPWIPEPETAEAKTPPGGDPAPPENGAVDPTNELVGAVALQPEPDHEPDSASRNDDSPEKMV